MEHANLGGASGSATFAGGSGKSTVRIRRKYLGSRSQIAEKLSILFGVKLGAELGFTSVVESSQFATFQVSSEKSGSVVIDATGTESQTTGDVVGLAAAGGAVGGLPVGRGVAAGGAVCGDLINQIQVSDVWRTTYRLTTTKHNRYLLGILGDLI